jgi:hypothetical protein
MSALKTRFASAALGSVAQRCPRTVLQFLLQPERELEFLSPSGLGIIVFDTSGE